MLFNSIMAASDAMTRPACPRCAGRMLLPRLDPEKPGHDTRTFECSKFQRCESVVVQYQAP